MEIHLQFIDYLRCYYFDIIIIVMSRAVAGAVSVSVSMGKPNEIRAASITSDGG